MSVVYCRGCGREIHESALACPQCGAPQIPQKKTRDVSALWTFVFGFFYFLAKGWIKSAVVALILAACTFGVTWLVIPFFAQRFVDAVEGD
ncbi:hypothetical protein [Paraburkholderia sp. J11-2]|uniref:hypothetical protein n=1 Tax=Paraburkholderia sp. J11-2 TaxID=2805431 RepID=UPI0039EFCB58